MCQSLLLFYISKGNIVYVKLLNIWKIDAGLILNIELLIDISAKYVP